MLKPLLVAPRPPARPRRRRALEARPGHHGDRRRRLAGPDRPGALPDALRRHRLRPGPSRAHPRQHRRRGARRDDRRRRGRRAGPQPATTSAPSVPDDHLPARQAHPDLEEHRRRRRPHHAARRHPAGRPSRPGSSPTARPRTTPAASRPASTSPARSTAPPSARPAACRRSPPCCRSTSGS